MMRPIFRRFRTLLFSKNRNFLSHRKNHSEKAVQLSTAEYGASNRDKQSIPIIVNHGLMGSKLNWHLICRNMALARSVLLAADARNHGESPHVEEMDYFLMSEDLIKVMEDNFIGRACLLGHSMGGKTAMITALTQPDRVKALIVVDVAPGRSPNTELQSSYLECMLKISSQFSQMEDLPLSHARKMAIKNLLPVVKDETIARFLAKNVADRDGKLQWKVNLDSIINSIQKLIGFPNVDTAYHGPTLFIHGGRSNYITPENKPEILRLFPTAKIVLIEDAGHWVHADKPTQFIDIVNEFLQKLGLAKDFPRSQYRYFLALNEHKKLK